MTNQENNASRFDGFADLYDSARPIAPSMAAKIIIRHLSRKPKWVVDLGCGTGLSTAIWSDFAEKIIGIEPNDGMRKIAGERYPDIEFRSAYSHETGLPNESVDIITCSQSFHWMEPSSTLAEVNRLLRPGGVFAVYDCDWPPCSFGKADKAYEKLFAKVHTLDSGRSAYPKERHLQNIKDSGYFDYVRELVFHNEEPCTATRYIALAESQGGLQAVRKSSPKEIEYEWEQFIAAANEAFGDNEQTVYFCYRMRLGVK
ncbi:MAG: class I SAM-dependent methyltransferase [Oscillospiraceae bacterium]|jgi:ubiquinone/menaquinone biosynthesis C-methylase UbiE|nr:class I SAM-dependent methyltransferase [Oscillospiraceae bacterium]